MCVFYTAYVSGVATKMNSIRPLSKQLQEKAIKELNEKPNSIEKDIQFIKEWLAKQSHLKAKNGTYYEIFSCTTTFNFFFFLYYRRSTDFKFLEG